jgi:predicted DNA-binding protein YlxM (UPF0122 family)
MDFSNVFDAGLGVLFAVISWVLKEKSAEIQRLSILLNRTREEVAKEYVTKQEVHTDINRILSRLEIIDTKFDRLLENQSRDRG